MRILIQILLFLIVLLHLAYHIPSKSISAPLYTKISNSGRSNAACAQDIDCWNGGSCNIMTGQCTCAPGFTGSDCSQRSCPYGHINPDGRCSCNGFGDDNCLMCSSDYACSKLVNTTGTNQTAYCDTTYISQQNRRYQCIITDDPEAPLTPLIGNISTMQCGHVPTLKEGGNGTCFFQTWGFGFDTDHPNRQVEIFFCTFLQCSLILDPKDPDKLGYLCESSKCKCGPFCNEYVQFVVPNMIHKGQIYCNNRTKACSMQHDDFPTTINLQCAAGECVTGPAPKPPPPDDDSWRYQLAAGLAGGILLVFLSVTMIVSCIFSILHTIKVKKEYEEMKHETHGASLEFRDLAYYLKVREKGKLVNKKLLKGVSYSIRPGSVIALMGASGAGKSTLLDILANRNKKGTVIGSILVNGKPIDDSYQRICGYVFQDDNLMGTMTVFESLMFAANLKLPDAVSYSEKKKRVEDVMRELGISHIADRRVGDAMNRGISGGEKRRVSIGMELVISPHILFLDEPTSGLDSASSLQVVECLTRLAKRGRTIVFSIHQPRSNIFNQFDEILLLCGGHIAYSGPASKTVDYFSAIGYNCPPHHNPADYVIDVLADAQKEGKTVIFDPELGSKVLKDAMPKGYIASSTHSTSPIIEGELYSEKSALLDSAYTKKTQFAINLKSGDKSIGRSGAIYEGKLTPFATSFYSQLITLSSRAFRNFYRNFYLMPAHYLSAIVMGVLLGLIYYDLGNNIAACQNRAGSIFFMCSLLCFTAMSSLELFITERAIYVRERANGYYSSSAYFFSKTLFDLIPLRIFPPIFMAVIAYYMIGLREGIWSTHFLWFVFILILFNLVSGGLCILIGSIAPSVASANVIATLTILSQSLFSGFMLNKDSIPGYLSWIKYLSFWNYSFEALMINEFLGFPIIVDPKNLPKYPADGKFWLDEFGFAPERFYLDIMILAGFAIGFIVISGILMRYFVREKR